ncbi:hypothetical protein [Kalamiella sp. sgz302252]|uniref:hypothetical protein n=1 Tax=Pantoea sp. sgz302252 TaxID=3341827 RepID=UPI0036D29DFA
MEFLSEHAIKISWAIFILIIFISLRGLKDQKEDIGLVRDWKKRNEWPGEICQARLTAWRQTKIRYGLNYLFVLTFEYKMKEYNAITDIKPINMSRLKKNMEVMVKFDAFPPSRIAVIDIDFQ